MAKDPYRFFRVEAREILDGLVHAATRLGKDASDQDLVASILRLAHTLKGAARVVKQPRIAEDAHAIEDLLAPFRAGAAVPPEGVARLLQIVDAITAALALLNVDPGQRAVAAEAAPTPASRVDIGELAELLMDLSEARLVVAALSRRLSGCQNLVDLAERAARPLAGGDGRTQRAALEDLSVAAANLRRDLGEDIEAARGRIGKACASGERLRLVRADDILPALERAAHDAAQECGRKITFVARGGETRLAGDVLAAARDALQHMVRNAVVHGIEEPAQRSSVGKPESGRVELVIERRGDRISFSCRDDGRGIDRAAVLAAAVASGAASADQAKVMGADQALRMILLPGVSTAKGLSQVSGRGIGMDVVRDLASRLHGDVEIESRDAIGATVTLVVPVSRSTLAAIQVACRGAIAMLPRSSIATVVRVGASDMVRTGTIAGIVIGGRVVPCVSMAEAMGTIGETSERGPSTAVVVMDGADRIALLVDRVTSSVEVTVEAVPALVGPLPLIGGVAIDVAGDLAPVIDPRALIAWGATRTHALPRDQARRRVQVLVIDDSLTTRMLEQSILESAGYEVDVASSAEEGLERAARGRYALFVVDVEMPGMNGFEFVAATRADAALRGTPAILVTSLSSPEHRRKGLEAGARAYIVKGEFDQGRFLDAIRGLVGPGVG